MSVRVLHLSNVYPHAASPAEGVFIQQQVAALGDAGIACEVIVGKPWLPDALARRWTPYKAVAGLPRVIQDDTRTIHFARHLQFPGYRMLPLTVSSLERAVLECVERDFAGMKFDLVHAHSAYPTGFAAAQIARALGVPYVVTLHIQDDAPLVEGVGARFYRTMLERAGAVVAVGSPLKRFVREKFPAVADAAIEIIPNGVDIHPSPEMGIEKLGSGTDIVGVGNLWRIKGYDYLLRALSQLRAEGLFEGTCTIVGDGPERAPLETLARELGIGDRVRFTGALPHAQALEVIASADIFALPSWQEAFGVVYLEAMAFGKPVIGCRGQGAQDIVLDGETGILVEPKDVASLADALRTLIQYPEMARAWGEKGKARAKLFSWQANARAYRELYLQLKKSSH